MRTLLKFVAIALVWLVLATVVMMVPTTPASAQSVAPADDAVLVNFGQRATDPSRVATDVLAFQRAEEPGGDEDAEIEEEEEEPDPQESAEEALEEAKEEALAKIGESSFTIYPPDPRQVVGLRSFLHVTDFIPTSGRATVEDQTVTVTAEPVETHWTFTENATGITTVVTCEGPGQPWTPGATDPDCGKDWEHSSVLTGTVNVTVEVGYRVSWDHEYEAGETIEGEEAYLQETSAEGELTVLEVLTWGVQDFDTLDAADPAEPQVHEPKVECSAGARFVGWFVPVDCETIQEIGELVGNFFLGCAHGVIGRITDIWDLVTALGEDPVAYVQEQIAGLQALWDLANENPEELIETVGRGFLELPEDTSDWGPSDWSDWAGRFICGQAFDYLTGRAGAQFLDLINLPGRRNANNGNEDNGDGNNNGDENESRCPHSSFEGDTLVVLGDGSFKRIDEVRPGDYVLSHDLDTSTWEPELVLAQWSHIDREPAAIVSLDAPGDGSINSATVTATADHLFWVDSTQAWTELQYVRAGDGLLSPNGPVSTHSVELDYRGNWTVWELSVRDNHNFTVLLGDTPVLVHNETPCERAAAERSQNRTEADALIDGIDPQFRPNHPDIDTSDLDALAMRDRVKPEATFDADGNRIDGWREAPRMQRAEYTVYEHPDGGFIYEKDIVDAHGVTKTVAVHYNELGYPDFGPHAAAEVRLPDGFTGSDATDFRAANEIIGLADEWGSGAPPGYNWHHVPDPDGTGGVLQLVADEVHLASEGGFPHRGGVSVNRDGER